MKKPPARARPTHHRACETIPAGYTRLSGACADPFRRQIVAGLCGPEQIHGAGAGLDHARRIAKDCSSARDWINAAVKIARQQTRLQGPRTDGQADVSAPTAFESVRISPPQCRGRGAGQRTSGRLTFSTPPIRIIWASARCHQARQDLSIAPSTMPGMGVSTMLEMGEAFAPLARKEHRSNSIAVPVLDAGKQRGLWGSAYCASPPSWRQLKHIVGGVNRDGGLPERPGPRSWWWSATGRRDSKTRSPAC